MEFLPLLTLPALILKLTDFVRYMVNADRNGVITQALVWVVSVLAVIAYAHSSLPDPPGLGLHAMNLWAQILIGLQAGSVASAGKDVLKAVDNQNSAAIPTLLSAGPASATGRHRTEG